MSEIRPPAWGDGQSGDFIGYFERVNGNQAIGWVLNRLHPERPVAVALFVDGHPVAMGWTSVFREDIHFPGFSGGTCGFCLTIPRSGPASVDQGILDESFPSPPRVVVAAVANTDVVLPGSPRPFIPGTGSLPPEIQGDINSTQSLRIRGWVHDAGTPGRRLTLDVVHDGQVVATAVADRFRQDLLAGGIGDGRHGFEVALPLQFADGQPHHFTLTVRETGDSLNRDGVTVMAEPFQLTQHLRHIPEDQAKPALDVLADYFACLHRDLPARAAFSDYAVWADLFMPCAPRPSAGLPECVAIIVSDGNATAENATLASLAAQDHVPVRAVILAPSGMEREPVPTTPGMTVSIIDRSKPCLHRIVRDPPQPAPFGAVILLRAGETLRPDGLAVLATALAEGAAVAYADGDIQTGDSRFPLFSPDWNHTFLLHKHYIGPACLIRRDVLLGVEEHDRPEDLLFRAIEAVGEGLIRHIPRIAATRPAGMVWPDETAAVQRHLNRRGWTAQVAPHPAGGGLRTVAWAVPSGPPKVSLIIPTRDAVTLLEACVGSLLRHTLYPAAEIIIIDNGSEEPATHHFFRRIQEQHGRIHVLPCPGPFNYAAINNAAVRAARGDLVAFVNNDIEIPESAGVGWLARLVSHFSHPAVGAVGPKLLYANGMIQHGGVIVGVNGVADHAFRHAAADDAGYDDRLRVPHEVSAVTAALMLTPRDLFLVSGGFDQDRFPIAFNDVDYCLRLRGLGRKVVFDPTVALFHCESATRGSDARRHRQGQAWREIAAMKERWAAVIAHDPAYNPNLNLDDLPFMGLAVPPRSQSHGRKG